MNTDKNFIEHLAQGRLTQRIRLNNIIQEYNKNPVKCLICNKPIEYKKRLKYKFCSSSCSAKHSNTNRSKDHGNCIICNSKLNYRQNKYCSQKCWGLDIQRSSNKSILNGTNKSKEPIKILKRIVVERDGNKCSICSMPSEWEFKPIVMILDHVDGNSENNNISNLRLVCPNCDSQLPTFKGRNIGNGRFKRKKRYQEGKSF